MSSGLTPDQQALVAGCVPWARRIADTFASIYKVRQMRGDLTLAAYEALTEAAASFDPGKSDRFEVFAWKRVTGKILDEISREIRHLRRLRTRLVAVVRTRSRDEEIPDAKSPTSAPAQASDRVADEAVEQAYLISFAGEQQADVESMLLQHEACAMLQQAMLHLTPRQKRLVELRYGQDLEWRQVAAALGIPERTARDHDLKLRHLLRSRLVF
jgi:RNA polymerase sigma factor (sigma-70 family)